MKPIHSILTSGLALAMLTASALALTLPVSEDSSTSGNASVAKSAGKGTTLAVSSARQGLIRFEAGAFADSVSAGDVSKARLVLFISGVTAPGALTLHRVTQDWSEHGSSIPSYDSKPLATIQQSSVVAKQFVIVDVTAAVQAWLREPGTDFGFAIAGSGGARVLLGSKEGAAAGHPAQLQIETDAAFLDEEGGRTRASATGPIGNFVTNADIVNNSLTGKKIKDASLLGKKLALATITADKLDATIGLWKAAGGNVFLPTGNVGIGTATPDLGLEVVGPSTAQIAATAHASTALFLGRSAGGTPAAETAITSGTEMSFFGAQGHTGTGFSGIRAAVIMNASENFTATAHGSEISFGTTQNGTSNRLERMRITNDGRVGIGITPTKAKVEISGASGGYLNVPPAGFLNALTPVGTTPGGFTLDNFSLYASEEIGAKVYFAFSDERIKHLEGRSDATRDLATLLSVQVTDYTYIDTLCKGAGKQKKLIAQQVEKVYPQAVRRTTDIVPDIFQKAEVRDGWVKLATNLKKGERVRLIGEKKEGIHEVLEVAEDQFRTDFAADGHEVFVYGREVKDFRNVDYEAIAMLNVSATQELPRKIEAKDAEVAKLRAENATLANKLATIEARDQAREARLARIEGALDAAPARVVRASLNRK